MSAAPPVPGTTSAPKHSATGAVLPTDTTRLTGTARREGAARRAWQRVRVAAHGLRWYVHELMGDTTYAKYLRRHEQLHPGVEPLTERAFWRQRHDEAEHAPVARCC